MATSVSIPTKPDWADGLTDRQRCFVEEYLIDLNGTQAAIRAGYAEAGAAVEAHRLLRNAKIAAAISGALVERTDVTQARIVDELAKIAFANAGDFFKWGPDGIEVVNSDQLTDDQKSIISEVSQTKTKDGGTIRVKMADKLTALEKLGKAVGMFRGKVEVTGKDGGPIKTEEMSNRDIARRIALALARADNGNQGQGPATDPR